MTSYFNTDEISSILSVPATNVAISQPSIELALQQQGLDTRPAQIAAIATIGVEVPEYLPIPEYGDGSEYEGRADLGNINIGDGPKYKGRGFIQLTGRANYTYYGQALGVDLVNNPDLALDKKIAAEVLAFYFQSRGVGAAAEAGNWTLTRILVNGGLNGWDKYSQLVNSLLALPLPQHLLNPVTYPNVIKDTELRSLPLLEAVARPIEVVKAGTTVTRLGPITPHWLYVKLPDGRKGWLYRPNLSNS